MTVDVAPAMWESARQAALHCTALHCTRVSACDAALPHLLPHGLDPLWHHSLDAVRHILERHDLNDNNNKAQHE